MYGIYGVDYIAAYNGIGINIMPFAISIEQSAVSIANLTWLYVLNIESKGIWDIVPYSYSVPFSIKNTFRAMKKIPMNHICHKDIPISVSAVGKWKGVECQELQDDQKVVDGIRKKKKRKWKKMKNKKKKKSKKMI